MTRRGARPVNERLRGLLVMLPWLQERQQVSTEEMAARFGLSVEDLVADLTLASLCGISDDPLNLIDLYVDEGTVFFGVPKYFDRPLRLHPRELAALVVAVKAASALPGFDEGGALSRAVAKIERVIGSDAMAGVDVEIDVPETVPPLRDAVESGAEMVLDHWSPESGETTRRTVAPIEIFRDGSHWYLRGIDRGAGAERTFRVDRILEWSPTGAVDRQPLTPRGAWFEDGHDLDEATLVVDRDRWWVLERYPIRAAETLADGRMRVRLVVTSQRWLERLLLRLGPHALVESPVAHRDLGRRAARRVRDRYART